MPVRYSFGWNDWRGVYGTHEGKMGAAGSSGAIFPKRMWACGVCGAEYPDGMNHMCIPRYADASDFTLAELEEAQAIINDVAKTGA